jgi:hypothetical protein
MPKLYYCHGGSIIKIGKKPRQKNQPKRLSQNG